ncbi:MAG: GNAT family N-acetyltransferase [Alphaproteobacteria bacterium]|nr:GNAT family N-acetyltransferase [Rhodospirillales bacterium]MCW9045738.1 GNAT family N-acetyltransferase [Alphaproteobacteria bacterium]
MKIRPIASTDRPRWQELWQGYLDFYKATLAPEITDTLWDRLHSPEVPINGLVAENSDGQVIGLLHYVIHLNTWNSSSICYLEDLYVDENIRGSGAGKALIEALRVEVKKQGWGRLYWMTDTKNDRARGLYDKLAKLTDYVRYEYPL